MALITFLDELYCVYLHSRPEITYSNDLAYQGPRIGIVPTNSFVDFFQDVLGFVFVDTLQVSHGEAFLV